MRRRPARPPLKAAPGRSATRGALAAIEFLLSAAVAPVICVGEVWLDGFVNAKAVECAGEDIRFGGWRGGRVFVVRAKLGK